MTNSSKATSSTPPRAVRSWTKQRASCLVLAKSLSKRCGVQRRRFGAVRRRTSTQQPAREIVEVAVAQLRRADRAEGGEAAAFIGRAAVVDAAVVPFATLARGLAGEVVRGSSDSKAGSANGSGRRRSDWPLPGRPPARPPGRLRPWSPLRGELRWLFQVARSPAASKLSPGVARPNELPRRGESRRRAAAGRIAAGRGAARVRTRAANRRSRPGRRRCGRVAGRRRNRRQSASARAHIETAPAGCSRGVREPTERLVQARAQGPQHSSGSAHEAERLWLAPRPGKVPVRRMGNGAVAGPGWPAGAGPGHARRGTAFGAAAQGPAARCR